MEEWIVLTFRDYDFEDERTGRNVKGRSLHCYRKTEDNTWPGVEYTKLSIAAGTLAYELKPVLGQNYRFSFDRRGKVTSMEPVK